MRETKIFKKLFGMVAMLCLTVMLFGMTTMALNKVENLAFGQMYENTDEDGTIAHYYRFSAKTSGVVSVSGLLISGNYTLGMNVSLCNARGKELASAYVNAGSSYESAKSVLFGVNKGLYQIKIQTPYTYRMAAVFTKYAEKSGNSQKKAVSLKKKSLKKGVLGLGESGKKVDYYKIVLKKPAKIKLEFASQANSTINADVIPGKDTKLKSTVYMSTYNSRRQTTLYVSPGRRNLPKGTYYIKVYRSSKNPSVSGIYTLKWKA